MRLALISRSALFAGAVSLLASSCGYHIAGKANTLPSTIRVIAIPPFENGSMEYKVEQYMTQAVVREFIRRTRYQIVADENEADATLRGVVINVNVYPAVFDPVSQRATSINTLTQIRVSLVDRKTGQVLYDNPNFEYRERYEVSTDANAYFEERQSALVRSSEATARSLVSAVLEGF
jgi:Lipopolysaccharide-assembly